jgi:hypothetical protein
MIELATMAKPVPGGELYIAFGNAPKMADGDMADTRTEKWGETRGSKNK